MTEPRTGARILVDQLRLHGTDQIFCVPGESYLAVLDALYDTEIGVTICRQEGGAAMMAEASGKLTGRPGICFVTRAPGATNAAAGIHVAEHDSTPMVLFVGQIARGFRGRGAFQEIDYRAVFGGLAKWATEIDEAARIPEIVAYAFAVACNGRPGPVVVALPEDMLTEFATVPDAVPAGVVETHPGGQQIGQVAALLSRAERPIAIVGGSRWSAEAVTAFADIADTIDLPVVCSFRRQMLFSAEHRCYAGDLGLGANPRLVERIQQSDLMLLIGGRLSEVASQGYELLSIPVPQMTLVHVHPDARELGRVYQPALAIQASPTAFITALARETIFRDDPAPEAAHAEYLRWSDPAGIVTPGAVQMGEVMVYLRATLPPETIFCNGAGNFATWVHRFWPFRRYGGQLAPTSGSMGYGIPAAVAAKRLQQDRPVVAISGDGDFMMTCQEFATAVQYGLPIIVILLDNGMYGTIRMHQETHYPGRVFGTGLRNPDFAAFAASFGGHGERVETTAAFQPAFERALASGKPAILHCLMDPEAITPTTTLAALRDKARQRLSN